MRLFLIFLCPSRDANPGIPDLHGYLPLHYAVMNGHGDVLETMLEFFPKTYTVLTSSIRYTVLTSSKRYTVYGQQMSTSLIVCLWCSVF